MVEAVKTKGFALDKKGGVVVNMKREGVQKARPGCRKIQITPQQIKNVLRLERKLSLTLLVLDIMLLYSTVLSGGWDSKVGHGL